ncbi:MAG: Obg family GTPase CgtA [Actinobacteria bacterium]|jgi:GTP-binding protein|nr:Obg family GTPase CgtA [Actinomycetota bacterium]MBT5655785.1 Obg family GTPase CgtA [Actinomycetota bacterium]MBT7014352.1 Obg family GTPase CgtA [Actinomycetota bacterium]
MFIDKIDLTLFSGSGGSGSISFSSKSSKTSPNGASGGKGGSIIIRTNRKLFDFSHIYSKSIFKAENGGDASKNLQSGKNANDLIIEVPLGTSVIDSEGLVAKLIHENQELKILQGGRGGLGNRELKSTRNINPGIAEQGQKRSKKEIKLELSLITDIAILGLPNSGKSTLIKKITNSNAKTDSYPFTTVSPNLGVIENLERKYIICDLPGLIKGAATGVGLGKSILKHLINTKVLIFLLDPSNIELNTDQQIKLLQNEVYSYDEKLEKLPVLHIVNKADLDVREDGMLNISALEEINIDILLQKLEELNINNLETLNRSFLRTELHKNNFSIQKSSANYWDVEGPEVDRITGLLGNENDVFNEISYRFENSVIPEELKLLGVKKGSTIKLGSFEFIYEN